MMYIRGAVSDRVKLTKRHVNIAKKYDPFVMSDESWDELRQHVRTRRRGLRRAEHVTETMSRLLSHERRHSFEGLRTAEDTWRDRKGHCIEINILLHRALYEAGINAGMMVTKNARGYETEGLKNSGIHPFPTFMFDGTLYVADAVGNCVREYNRSLWLCQTPMNFTEFVSFCMRDSGEDLGLVHGRYGEAMKKLEMALEIDPNNYTVLAVMGDVCYNRWTDSGHDERFLRETERYYRMLVRKAPYIADSYAAYGEFCLGAYESPEWALGLYKKALKRPTMDAQVLWNLRNRFSQLGEKELQKVAEDYTSWLIDHLDIRDYFEGV